MFGYGSLVVVPDVVVEEEEDEDEEDEDEEDEDKEDEDDEDFCSLSLSPVSSSTGDLPSPCTLSLSI